MIDIFSEFFDSLEERKSGEKKKLKLKKYILGKSI